MAALELRSTFAKHLDVEALYKTDPPKFGHDMHKVFGFDPKYINLNHGSYGSLPLPVRAECDRLTSEIESSPDRFLRLIGINHLNEVRERIAKFIGANTDEIVIVNNASHGIGTILRNIEWHKGDIILGTTTTYGAVSQAIKYLADIPPNPDISTFNLQFPISHSEIIIAFREHIRKLTQRPDAQDYPERKTVAVIDSIVSNPGARLPWKEMVSICKEAGVWTVVDAAHSIGQEPNINLSEAQPDFWVSNCHKWLLSKRGCAVLYVPHRNQHIIKSPIPTPVTYLSPHDEDYHGPELFTKMFEWTGTIDFVPYFSVTAVFDFRKWIGGEEKIYEYCHNLALTGGKRLAQIMGTSVMDEDGELTYNMVNVELPIPGTIQPTSEIDALIKTRLLLDRNMYAAHFHHNGKWWTRCSTQIWNEISDFEALGEAFNDISLEVVKSAGNQHVTCTTDNRCIVS